MAEETTQDQVASSWTDAINEARSEATAGRPKRRVAREKNQPVSQEAQELAEVANELMKPEYWQGLVRAPADYMLLTTGHEHWNLTQKETHTLATTGALTAKAFLTIDPRWIALILFLTNAAFIYGHRFIAEMKIQRMEELERMEKREPKP